MYQITKLYHYYLYCLQHLQNIKRHIFDFLLCLPTSLFALLLLILLFYNGFSVFYIHIPSIPAKISPVPAGKLAVVRSDSSSSSSSSSLASLHEKLASSVLYAVKEENPPVILKTTTQWTLLDRDNFSTVPINSSLKFKHPKVRKKNTEFKILSSGPKSKKFSVKVKKFLDNSSCKLNFFMTWISSVDSFGVRELFVIESLFKSHPNACLVMVSISLDSKKGNLIFKPFSDKGFKVIAVRPDFDYLFNNTQAETWFKKLKKGNVDPGLIALGQNLSNLLRLSLLYKFGGIYLDTDVIVLKSFSDLRNTIGAQTMDSETRNWTRLNNAVLIFDQNHPLLLKFIQEFALTFDGNKWGHNGPYLVSRVVSRVGGRPGFNFTVLPPSAFYPVDWSRIQSFFQGPGNEKHTEWLHNKLKRIRRQSFTVHLWNRQSKQLQVEEKSILHHLMLDCCVFCNSSLSIKFVSK
ncbi:hypothetical protein LWI29_021396 [Acer saccharum]|uniref:Alpha 1,4-glycosyltransferase domain-containing protein n=1 Tax=Acer saccharum TaxID=4024 RepID=A0AA39VHZ3_ACESA|nr:hypothetical protein LWI29_021396 [Acer saccharum]